VSAVTAPVMAQSARDSLGGAWTTSFTVWAVLLVPALALSVYQDFGEPYPNILVAAVAGLLPCATVGLVFLAARLLRRHTTTIPLVFCVAFWVSVGVVHGVTAATLDTVLAGTKPHFLAQSIFWTASTLIWLPLVTYAIAQSAYRRGLLASLQREIRTDSFLRRSSLLEIADLRSLIVNAIHDNIRPVLVEIEHSLESISPALDGTRLAELGRQLSDVSEETTRIIDTTIAARPTQPEAASLEPSAPVTAALDFDQARPFAAAVLSCVALLPLVVAVEFNEGAIDVLGVESAGLILAVVTVLLVAGLASQRLVCHLRPTARIASTLVTYAVAGVAAAVIAIVGPWQPTDAQNLALALLLPIAVPLAAATLSAAVGLGTANLGVVRQIAEVDDGIVQFENKLDNDRSDIRSQVSALTHGPLRGRLAACAMALNFHAAEIGTSEPARTEYIVRSVREHLAEVLDELDSLG
jgi:predicted DNA-binding protein YlxM (UPF0122 family)